MKRIVISMGILSIFFTATFFFLIYDREDPFQEEAKKYICIANSGLYYWNPIHNGMKDADREMGSYTKWVEFDRYDIEEQIRQLKKTQYLDLDGVITVGEPYSAELNEAIQEIVARGIPVALIDTDAPDSGRTYYIGTDNHKAGYLAAQAIAENTNGNSDALIIVSKLTYANQNERYQGFLDGIAEYENMNLVSVVEAEGDKLTMQEQLTEAFQKFPSINAVFCAESSSSRRLGPFLENIPKRELTVIGFDHSLPTLEFIQENLYAGTIAQSSYDIGYQAVACLNGYEEGAKTKRIYTDATYVTNDNISDFIALAENSENASFR